MGALGNPKPWVPFMDTKDCSQGFCSFYCPQWCYIILPPPPPNESPDDSSGSTFSPLVIAIVSILASAFLLVSYYLIISKYCGNRNSARRRENRVEDLEDSDNDPSNHEPWHVATAGLDDALIESITVFKYKKDEGLIEGTDCSVCLSEFKEEESLRLLPKCTHAFHVSCIDKWLKSHSSCPLCRANIVFVSSSPLPLPTVVEPRSNGESLSDSGNSNTNENSTAGGDDLEMGYREEVEEEILPPSNAGPKTPRRALSDLGNSEERDAFVVIRNEEEEEGGQEIRRSVSMDYSCESRFSIADVLRLKQEDEDIFQGGGDVGSSKRAVSGMMSKSSCQRSCRVLHCVMSPVAMKRSFSSGRFSFSRCGRGRNTMIPL